MTFTRITPRLEPDVAMTSDDDECPEPEPGAIVTTQEELEAFYIVRAILRQVVQCSRIQMRNEPTACNVLLDGDRGKPICRFHLRDMTRRAVFFTQSAPQVTPIERVNELYDYAQLLRAIVARYDRDFPPVRLIPDREVLA